jgi:multimeric flavodoxin WrbA
MESSTSAFILVCSLKPSPTASSSDKLANEIITELKTQSVDSVIMRAVDYNIKPGVLADMGEDDDWPALRQRMLDADIFIIATPTWVGHMSSVAQRIIERLDDELSHKDSEGRLLTYGKVAGVAVVGNEDGAHAIIADLFQGLNDVGFTIPAAASTYWNGEAMHSVDYNDLKETPKATAAATKTMAAHLAHTARLLRTNPYPAT